MSNSENTKEANMEIQDQINEENKEKRKGRKKVIQGNGNMKPSQSQMHWKKRKKIETKFQK